MFTVRIDPHAHLYDQYPLDAWCQAAAVNLGVTSRTCGVVIVADREGQDSFARLRRELPTRLWEEGEPSLHDQTCRARVVINTGLSVYVIRGVQYVSAERIEVLGLGVQRRCADGVPCLELIKRIRGDNGVVYLPWSPGKWLGARGRLVMSLIEESPREDLLLGDISLHARFFPPSLILRRATRMGFNVVSGTDPLPRAADVTLVGSYGVQYECSEAVDLVTVADRALCNIVSKTNALRSWGRPNSLVHAFSRFISTL